MYLALISGYTEVMVIEETEEQAKAKAIKEKRKLAEEEDLPMWTWQACEEYFGANVYELLPGTVIIDREMKGDRKC